ncbi:MAG TPA: hypothetical protein DEF41_06705 [Desulfovibrio sp.]|uniref:Uncharacterized protein n=1 Tax=Nitratidesulfovibrio vulgaris (strain ATCC 29579 / DSM 644 / CCUG 34227 / NCIMB 8303 / VKM B-1760 / Hildenborough) TaxID=882 RepID=Q72CA5_NITV2|nr:hypothetical protein DVU_1379 [Nitratidesulfovibrio vulgaris str. Hildenborough]HBW15815.1 hypothetical protein [Desulfovibrio sp.]
MAQEEGLAVGHMIDKRPRHQAWPFLLSSDFGVWQGGHSCIDCPSTCRGKGKA